MYSKKKRNILREIVISCSVICLVNLFFLEDPGFGKIEYTPYLIVPIIISIYANVKWGLFSLLLSTIYIEFSVIFFKKIGNIKAEIVYDFPDRLLILIPITLIIMYITSIIVGQLKEYIETLRDRVKKLSRESLIYKRSVKSLQIVNREFELRLSKSQESITALYNQIEKMGGLNSKHILQIFLETLQLFTKTSKATVWFHDENKHLLKLVVSIGYSKNEPGPYLSLENSVEGFVYRNNQFFSIRNINDFQSIIIHQAKFNIITVPINVGRKVWGVLNIEEMPFEKYSRYSEQLIHIITNLMVPYLEKSIKFEIMVEKNDHDRVNDLPFFSQFYSLLEEQIQLSWKDQSSLSVIIFELVNQETIARSLSKDSVRKLFSDTVISIFKDAGHEFYFFNYKESNQISVLSANLDFDGVSYYCVKAFRKFSEGGFQIYDEVVDMELSVGYSTQKDVHLTADTILDQAELLLNMAKF